MGNEDKFIGIQDKNSLPGNGEDLDRLTDVTDLQTQDKLLNRLSWRFNLRREEDFIGLLAAREKKAEDDLDLLEQLTTPSLAERMERLMARMEELDRASLKALREAEIRTRKAAERLRTAQDGAAVTSDGRRIYRTADGQHAFFEDGREATRPERDAVEWKPNMPTWEEYGELSRTADEATRREAEIREYRERLQRDRERIENGQPISADEIDDLKLDIDTMPDAVREQLSASSSVQKSAAHELMKDDPMPSAPDATASFSQVATKLATPAPQNPTATPVIRRDV